MNDSKKTNSKKTLSPNPHKERGIALITALLAMMMLLALGMALVFSATTDTTTMQINRTGQQAFAVADSGISIARRALAVALREAIDDLEVDDFVRNNPPPGSNRFRDVQVIPIPNGTWNNAFYVGVRDRAKQLVNNTARNQIFSNLNGTSFSVEYSPFTGDVKLIETNNTIATETIVLRYAIAVTGRTEGGSTATVNETGNISINVNLTASGEDEQRDFAFSGFGAFFEYGDTGSSSYLAAGTFTGPVHTNSHFAFSSSRNVAFRNVVSQVDAQIRYDGTNSYRNIPNTDIAGIDISSEGYKRVAAVPLPDNNFSQEFAIINGTGIRDMENDGVTPVDEPTTYATDSSGNRLPVFDSSGRVTQRTMAANLRNTSNNTPTLSSGNLPTGVYISSTDGSTITGAGIYVQGTVADLQLVAETNGDQTYIIKQGSNTTTIKTKYSTNQTTMQLNNGTVRTYSGIFKDKFNPDAPKNATSLFVNGGIDSLHGGKNGSTNLPAIASNTALTVTAQRHITITGDIKYKDPVLNSDGTPVANISNIKNVLGIFTNDGNVELEPNTSYVSSGRNLEMHAAVVSFNSNTSNDSGNIEGSIVYTGSTSPGSNDRWKLVGSRVQWKINNIGYSNRDIFFDVRYSGGKFAPPFFPGTTYELAPVPTNDDVAVSSIDDPVATAMSWFRDNN